MILFLVLRLESDTNSDTEEHEKEINGISHPNILTGRLTEMLKILCLKSPPKRDRSPQSIREIQISVDSLHIQLSDMEGITFSGGIGEKLRNMRN